jgi:hypothetical protein
MDYLEVESDFTGEISVEPLNDVDLQRALRAARLFGPETYPPTYIAELTDALSVLSQHPAAVSIAVQVDGASRVSRSSRSKSYP